MKAFDMEKHRNRFNNNNDYVLFLNALYEIMKDEDAVILLEGSSVYGVLVPKDRISVSMLPSR